MGNNEVVLKISNCSKCPNHKCHQIYTEDSFEHEFGIYCTKIEANPDERWACKTMNGWVKYRLVVFDDWDPAKYAKVPDWCPLLKKE